MVDAKIVAGLVERFEKAKALVEGGAVYPVSGLAGYSVVRNGDGNSMYLVRHDGERQHCTCPDFTGRQEALGLPCKHILAAQLAPTMVRPAPNAPKASGKPLSAGEQELVDEIILGKVA